MGRYSQIEQQYFADYAAEQAAQAAFPSGESFERRQHRISVLRSAGPFDTGGMPWRPVGPGPTAQQANQERLRFLREQTRRGRISTVLSGPATSGGGGFQLGKKSLLGA